MWKVNKYLSGDEVNGLPAGLRFLVDAEKVVDYKAQLEQKMRQHLDWLYDMCYIQNAELTQDTAIELKKTMIESELRPYWSNPDGTMDFSILRQKCALYYLYQNQDASDFLSNVINLYETKEQYDRLNDIVLMSNKNGNLKVQPKFKKVDFTLLTASAYPYNDVWIHILKDVDLKSVKYIDMNSVMRMEMEASDLVAGFRGARRILEGGLYKPTYNTELEAELFIKALNREAPPLRSDYLTYLRNMSINHANTYRVAYSTCGSTLLRDLWSKYVTGFNRRIELQVFGIGGTPIAVGKNKLYYVRRK